MTSENEQLQHLMANIQVEQSRLQEAIVASDKRLAVLTDGLKRIINRLESLEHSHNTRVGRKNSSAGPKLANIPELLEVVLFYLPIRDLLLAQRVSKRFKAVIDKSQAIQQRLFLLPETEPTNLLETDIRINPLLVDENSFIGIPLYRSKHATFSGRPVFVIGSQWNSRKLRVARCEVVGFKEHPSGRRTCRAQIQLARLPGTTCYGCAEKVGKSTKGSWRGMYITQPPLEIMYSFAEDPWSASGSAGRLAFGNIFPWRIRTANVGDTGSGMDDQSDGDEVDATANEGE